jgi:hypothetical protein
VYLTQPAADSQRLKEQPKWVHAVFLQGRAAARWLLVPCSFAPPGGLLAHVAPSNPPRYAANYGQDEKYQPM